MIVCVFVHHSLNIAQKRGYNTVCLYAPHGRKKPSEFQNVNENEIKAQ